jgi:hypothetical protein
MPKHAIIEISLDAELLAAFKAAAETAHRPPAEIVSELVQDYVERQQEVGPGYQDFLREKVVLARDSMKGGRGRPNDEVEAAFTNLRDQIRRAAP